MTQRIKIGAGLCALAALGLGVPSSGPLRAEAVQQTLAEQSDTCVGIYYAYTRQTGDANYLSMVARFAALNGLDADTAAENAKTIGKNVLQVKSNGALTEIDVIDTARACSNIFKIALPIEADYGVLPSLRPQSTQATYSAPSPAPEPARNTMCENALDAYTVEMRRLPERLSDVGPSYFTGCDQSGRMCGTTRPNSKFFYALGKACDAIKATIRNAQSACSNDRAALEGMAAPDRCD